MSEDVEDGSIQPKAKESRGDPRQGSFGDRPTGPQGHRGIFPRRAPGIGGRERPAVTAAQAAWWP